MCHLLECSTERTQQSPFCNSPAKGSNLNRAKRKNQINQNWKTSYKTVCNFHVWWSQNFRSEKLTQTRENQRDTTTNATYNFELGLSANKLQQLENKYISKDIKELKNTTSQLDLTDIYKNNPPNSSQTPHSFQVNTERSPTNHMVGLKTSLNKAKKDWNHTCTFSHHGD